MGLPRLCPQDLHVHFLSNAPVQREDNGVGIRKVVAQIAVANAHFLCNAAHRDGVGTECIELPQRNFQNFFFGAHVAKVEKT